MFSLKKTSPLIIFYVTIWMWSSGIVVAARVTGEAGEMKGLKISTKYIEN